MSRAIRIAMLTVALMVLGGLASAAIPDSAGKIDGCYAKIGGVLRVIDKAKGEACLSKLEVPITWNQAGPQGPAGPAGPAGVEGQPGKDGNLALAGQSCPAHSAVTGFDAAGNIICTELPCAVRLTGTIASISPPSLVVGDTTVRVDSATAFDGVGSPSSLGDLVLGDSVHVCGSFQEGNVLASSLTRF